MNPEVVLGILLVAGGVVWRLVAPGAARTLDVQFWQWVTYSGAVYLAIGLVRDLYIKYFKKATCAAARAGEPTICLESTVGPLIVLAGLGVLAAGVRHVVPTPHFALAVGLGVLFILSGLCKDIVLVIRREPNHISLIPW